MKKYLGVCVLLGALTLTSCGNNKVEIEIEELSNEVRYLTEIFNEAQSQVEELESEVEKLEAEIERLEKENEEYIEKLEKEVEEVEKLENVSNDGVYYFDDLEVGDSVGLGVVKTKEDSYIQVSQEDCYKGKVRVYYNEMDNEYSGYLVDSEYKFPTIILRDSGGDIDDVEVTIDTNLYISSLEEMEKLLPQEEIEKLQDLNTSYTIDFYIEASGYSISSYIYQPSTGFLEITKIMPYEDYLESRE